MAELESRLRRTNQKQAALYLFCNFISLMLMTAYSGLMFSPTVQDIFLREATAGNSYTPSSFWPCSAALYLRFMLPAFFPQKSRQLGILMALGASRKHWRPVFSVRCCF